MSEPTTRAGKLLEKAGAKDLDRLKLKKLKKDIHTYAKGNELDHMTYNVMKVRFPSLEPETIRNAISAVRAELKEAKEGSNKSVYRAKDPGKSTWYKITVNRDNKTVSATTSQDPDKPGDSYSLSSFHDSTKDTKTDGYEARGKAVKDAALKGLSALNAVSWFRWTEDK